MIQFFISHSLSHFFNVPKEKTFFIHTTHYNHVIKDSVDGCLLKKKKKAHKKSRRKKMIEEEEEALWRLLRMRTKNGVLKA